MKVEKTNEENKKDLLVLAYFCWWKLRAIKNMAYLKAKAVSEVHFDSEKEEEDFGNVLAALLAGLDAKMILDMTKDYKKQYLKAGSPPFDIVPIYDGVSLQKDAEVIEE